MRVILSESLKNVIGSREVKGIKSREDFYEAWKLIVKMKAQNKNELKRIREVLRIELAETNDKISFLQFLSIALSFLGGAYFNAVAAKRAFDGVLYGIDKNLIKLATEFDTDVIGLISVGILLGVTMVVGQVIDNLKIRKNAYMEAAIRQINEELRDIICSKSRKNKVLIKRHDARVNNKKRNL